MWIRDRSGTSDVVIEDGESDLFVAIDRAADRTERAVARRLERLREHRHERFNSKEPAGVELAEDAGLTPAPH